MRGSAREGNERSRMEQFLSYHRKMFVLTAILCGAVAVGIGVLLPGDWLRLLGFLVGAAAQLIKFGFLDVSTVKRMAAAPDQAAKLQLRATFLSLLIFCLALAVAFKFSLDIWMVAAGIFLPRIILIIDSFVRPDPFTSTAGDKIVSGDKRK